MVTHSAGTSGRENIGHFFQFAVFLEFVALLINAINIIAFHAKF